MPTSGYAYKRAVTIDHTKVSASDSSNFPMLLSGTFSYLATIANGGLISNSGGYDIVFTSDAAGNTFLNWEIEDYDPATGTLQFLIQVPTVSHTADTTIYMWYANPAIVTFQGGAQGAAWDANFLGVYHFPNGAVLSGLDSTANGNNAVLSTPPTAATGKIDGGVAFAATSSEFLTIAATAGLDAFLTNDWTLETWSDPTAPLADLTLFGNQTQVRIFQIGENSNLGYLSFYNGSAWFDATATPVVTAGVWNHLVMTWVASTGTLSFYVNGVLVGVPATGVAMTAVTGNWLIGSQPGNFYNGALDEFRISKTARSSDWVLAEYNNQFAPSTFVTIGPQTSPSSFSPIATDTLDIVWNFATRISHAAFGTNLGTRITR